eukprot:TRINITY_DN3688_c0_g1_i2.p1 TRINITY_DN3688_c0_g1~~TRINITY_DN3688_c0_g1_i2.p1  ORF type:complete len:190 (+),score=26.02 TRINITY_DN3688_c0_g1_i2:97-666(+)
MSVAFLLLCLVSLALSQSQLFPPIVEFVKSDYSGTRDGAPASGHVDYIKLTGMHLVSSTTNRTSEQWVVYQGDVVITYVLVNGVCRPTPVPPGGVNCTAWQSSEDNIWAQECQFNVPGNTGTNVITVKLNDQEQPLWLTEKLTFLGRVSNGLMVFSNPGNNPPSKDSLTPPATCTGSNPSDTFQILSKF